MIVIGWWKQKWKKAVLKNSSVAIVSSFGFQETNSAAHTNITGKHHSRVESTLLKQFSLWGQNRKTIILPKRTIHARLSMLLCNLTKLLKHNLLNFATALTTCITNMITLLYNFIPSVPLKCTSSNRNWSHLSFQVIALML